MNLRPGKDVENAGVVFHGVKGCMAVVVSAVVRVRRFFAIGGGGMPSDAMSMGRVCFSGLVDIHGKGTLAR